MKDLNLPGIDADILSKLAVTEHMSLPDIALKLNIELSALEDFYLRCFREDRKKYPLEVLVTKEWLEQQLETKTVFRIATELNQYAYYVKKMMKQYGIKRKPKVKDMLTPEVLTDLFVNRFESDAQIASRYNCSIDMVKTLRYSYNITTEFRKTPEQRLPIEFFYRLYVEMDISLNNISKLFNLSFAIISELKNKYTASNHPLASEIQAHRCFSHNNRLFTQLLASVDSYILIDRLRTSDLYEVAAEYNLVPKSANSHEPFSKDWLEAELQTKTVAQLAEEYSKSYSYVRKLVVKYGLAKEGPSESIDADLVYELYVNKFWSVQAIANLLSVSVNAINQTRLTHHITSDLRQPLHERLNLDTFYHLYVEESMKIAQIAALFDVSYKRIAALKSEYASSSDSRAFEIAHHHSRGISQERFDYIKKSMYLQ